MAIISDNFWLFCQFSSGHPAPRKIWRVENQVAGYVREAKNLLQVMVRNAGHILPYDQPKWAFDMIQRFIQGKEF